MGWALTGLGVALIIVIAAGATLVLCKRYCIGWQFGTRNVWSVCEEWRQRLSWLWAPREEKVGLVKAQHPTAQTIPGLYRQTGNASQHLLHSDSDLRLDAQGAFTRFEAVDRDLHPPLGGSTIPPQPLRPAPQPRPTARPRPSPLQTPSTVDYIRMHEAGPGPLTPPPSLQRESIRSRAPGPSVFLFQSEPLKNHDPFQSIERSTFVFDNGPAKTIAESIQMTPYSSQNHVDSRLIRQFEPPSKEPAWLRYGISAPLDNRHDKLNDEDVNRSYGSYEIVHRNHVARPYARNESRGFSDNFNTTNSSNVANQMILESIYGPQTISKMLQNSEELNGDLNRKNSDMQNIEMTPFKNTSGHQEDVESYMFHNDLSKSHDLQRVSQYIQSLPDLPVYESMNELQARSNRESILFANAIQGSIVDETKIANESALSSIPPPPAPPDPSQEITKKSPTTGERIFSALRSVTSQSYIDASEFYNSVLSSAQQVQRLAFPSTSPSFMNDTTEDHLQDPEYLQDMRDIYAETDPDLTGLDGSRRSSDLYSPELNLEAHRTAQEVYNSLQDPPSSPLLLKDHNHESYTYLSDPSFTRTSEDIFNSLEQRRKSIERLNGIHEYVELDTTDPSRRRNSQELIRCLRRGAIEETTFTESGGVISGLRDKRS